MKKSLPPAHSFLPLETEGLVLSSLKKADAGNEIVVRFYENAGKTVSLPISFLGSARRMREVNLLEEDAENLDRQTVTIRPYEIKTLRLRDAQ